MFTGATARQDGHGEWRQRNPRRSHEPIHWSTAHPGRPRFGLRCAQPSRGLHRDVHEPVRRDRRAAPARGRRGRRSAPAAGARVARELVRLAPAHAGAGPGLRGHRGRSARHRAVRQARGRVRHGNARRRPGRADGRTRPPAVRGGRPRHRIRDQLRAGRRSPGPRRPRGPGRDPRPPRCVAATAPVRARTAQRPALAHPLQPGREAARAAHRGERERLLRLRVRHPGRQAPGGSGRLLRRDPVRPRGPDRQPGLLPGVRRHRGAERAAQEPAARHARPGDRRRDELRRSTSKRR